MFKLLFSQRIKNGNSKSIKRISCLQCINWLNILYHKDSQNTNPCRAKLCKCPLRKNRQIDHQNEVRSYFPAREVILRVQRMQKSSSVLDELFCTRSGIPPVRHMAHELWRRTVGGGEPVPDIPKTRRKRFHTQLGLCPCCNHIVTLLKPICNSFSVISL